MLIEFIGFSSSGKTTLIKELGVILNKRIIIFNDIELEFLNKNYCKESKSNYLKFLINLKSIFYFFKYFSFKKIKNILALINLTQLSYSRKIAYFRNHIKKISLVYFYIKKIHKNPQKILLFDEGFIQGTLNILNHINNDNGSLNLEDIDLTFFPDILICLKPDTDKLIKSIRKRKDRKYWLSLSDKELKIFINRFNKNMEKIINFYNQSKTKKVLILSNIEDCFNDEIFIDFIIKNSEKNRI